MNSGSQPCPAAVDVSLLGLCGVKEGSNFIVLFLDFNLGFNRYATLCAWIDRDVCAQFLGTSLRLLWALVVPRFPISLWSQQCPVVWGLGCQHTRIPRWLVVEFAASNL